MTTKKKFSREEAKEIGDKIGVDWDKFSLDEFCMGVNVELEHGRQYPQTNVTEDDPTTTGKIALAHLFELPDYYTRLKKMEDEGEKELKSKSS